MLDIMQIESQKKYRKFLIVYLYLICVIYSIGLGISYELESKEFFYTLAFSLVLTQICVVDGKIVGKPLPTSTHWLIFMLYSIAVPICIVRAHGVKGLGIIAIHYIGIVLVSTAFFSVTYLLLYG